MVLARVANLFTNGDATNSLTDTKRRHDAITMETVESPVADTVAGSIEGEIDDEAARPPYLHVRMPSWDGTELN
jgi:hypothetical protein